MYRGATGHFFNNYINRAKKASEIRNGACVRIERNYYEDLTFSIYNPNDYPGAVEMIDNIEIGGSDRPYPKDCKADIPYSYDHVLTQNTEDVKTVVPAGAGVGKL
jgi:pectate lyase